MYFSRRAVIAASGLVLAGCASLDSGAAIPVGVAVATVAPQNRFPHDGCCSRGRRLGDRSVNVNRHSQRTIIHNRTIVNNISRNDTDAKQRQQLENASSPVASSTSAATGGGGGAGGGGG